MHERIRCFTHKGPVTYSCLPSSVNSEPYILTKVGFFAWEASWGKVLTLDQLKHRGRVLVNRCFLCQEEEEIVEHLLVHCPRARML